MNIFRKLFWKLLAPVRWRLENLEDKQKYLFEREIVSSSPLWDEYYYLQNYHKEVHRANMLPLDHYLQIGWKTGCNPSRFFQNDQFGAVGHNPLVDYLLHGRMHSRCVYSSNVYPVSSDAVNKYLDYKRSRTAKSVVYTCITNDYDDITALPAHYYTDPNWDYVCFSDNEELISQQIVGVWEIRPLAYSEKDHTRNNRYHKLFPHVLFPEYETSVYIDGNINVLTSYLFDEISRRQSTILLPLMLTFRCLYQTEQWLIDNGADEQLVRRQFDIYRQEGFPPDYGMFENNIIYRVHKDAEVQNMMSEWWGWICDYCQRDQASLAYIFWKHHLSIEGHSIHNVWYDYINFCLYPHLKQRVFHS